MRWVLLWTTVYGVWNRMQPLCHGPHNSQGTGKWEAVVTYTCGAADGMANLQKQVWVMAFRSFPLRENIIMNNIFCLSILFLCIFSQLDLLTIIIPSSWYATLTFPVPFKPSNFNLPCRMLWYLYNALLLLLK